MKANKHITDLIFLVSVILIHLVFYSNFYLELDISTQVYLDDYIKYILSDTVVFGSNVNILLLLLRSNLIFGMAILFSILPLLRCDTEYKKIELIFYGSYARYIFRYLKLTTLRAIVFMSINIIAVALCGIVYNVDIVFGNNIIRDIVVYILMILACILFFATFSIITSVHITRNKLIINNIIALSTLLIIDLFILKASLIYYEDSTQTMIGLSVYSIIIVLVTLSMSLKGKRK